MKMKELRFRLSGSAPLLMHSGELANPLDEWSKKMKKISSKRGKTDADYEAMAKIEYLGGLYTNEAGEPIIPVRVLEGTLIGGAKKKKLGKLFTSAVFVNEDAVLEYDGPKSAEKLVDDPKFRLTAGVKVGQARVMRTRPMFPEWSLEVTVSYIEGEVEKEDIVDAFNSAGILVGLGDWRPKYGRFTSELIAA